jgi:hypothetical protein
LAYTDTQSNQAIHEGKEKMLARMFLNRVDRVQHGTMIVKLHNDYVTGQRDVHPNDRISAFSLINNWQNENERPIYNPNLNSDSCAQDGTKFAGGISWWGYGREGATLSQCTNANCLKKYKAKQDRKQSAYDQGRQHLNMVLVDKLDLDTDHQDSSDKEYCEYDVGSDFHQGKDLLNNLRKKNGGCLILLDSQSTHSTFFAAELVENIRNAVRPLQMTTNDGTIIYNQQADFPNHGVMWFNLNSIANIISMSEAERRGLEITYSPGCLKLTNEQKTLEMTFLNQASLYAYVVIPI